MQSTQNYKHESNNEHQEEGKGQLNVKLGDILLTKFSIERWVGKPDFDIMYKKILLWPSTYLKASRVIIVKRRPKIEIGIPIREIYVNPTRNEPFKQSSRLGQ